MVYIIEAYFYIENVCCFNSFCHSWPISMILAVKRKINLHSPEIFCHGVVSKYLLAIYPFTTLNTEYFKHNRLNRAILNEWNDQIAMQCFPSSAQPAGSKQVQWRCIHIPADGANVATRSPLAYFPANPGVVAFYNIACWIVPHGIALENAFDINSVLWYRTGAVSADNNMALQAKLVSAIKK